MKKISFLLIALLAFSSVSYAQKKKKEKKKKNKTEVSKDNGKVLLRYKLKKGDTFTQVVESNQKITITSMSMEMPMTQSYTFKNNVTDVDGTGNVTTEMTYERVYMKQSNPMTGAEMEFDSDDDKKQPTELSMLKDMKGKKITSTAAPNGKITNISDEAAKQAMNGTSNEFPETPVGVGDTWERTVESKSQAGVLVVKSTYKVLERKDGMMTVDINSKVTQEGKEAGTQTGKMVIEESTGLVIENNVNQKLNISAQGMDVIVDGVTKVTTKK
jgi:Family of unknown function (DUF6263)